jgi:flagellar protein FlaJ
MALPIFSRPYRVLSYKIMHRLRISTALSRYFESIKPLLHKAGLYMALEEYIATAIFTILITAPFLFIFVRTALITVYDIIAVAATVFAFVLTVVYVGGIFIGFFVYPQYKVDKIRRNIEMNLPYATTHMATVAGTGVPIYLVFKIIGDFPEYGELSKECRRIARNIEVFGYDTITALSETAAETPSPNFKDLTWGIVSIIRTGGDMRSFLIDKARLYMENQKNLENEYIDSLELMAEAYTTVFVAGPVLFVIMATIMGSVGSLPIDLGLLFTLVIYIIMPILAVGFILMVEGSKPIGA